MPSCVIKWCRNNTKVHKKSEGISFHMLPTNIIIRDEWIAAIRLSRNEPEWQPSSFSVVCSDHFDKNDMYYTQCGLRRIHRMGYPTKVVLTPQVSIKPDPDAIEQVNIKQENIEKENIEEENMEEEEANSGSEDTDINRSSMFERNQDFSEIAPILREMSSTLQIMANKQEDTFESFGKYVANTLRNMPERNSQEMQLQIVRLLMANENKPPANSGEKS